ncbi:hypothetical protein NCCP133_09660 [Cytobacillus sp. NCCP-133]|nr:hypothetical protein NCCP133_09660 [Cytobacillus sp. NCCP-133]
MIHEKKQHLFLKGIGLINSCAISVHFSKWNEKKNLEAATKNIDASIGYGIDDGAGIYFKSEVPATMNGNIHTYKKT